jgi:hypothetical protein
VEEDQRDFPRLLALSHLVPYLVQCTLECAYTVEASFKSHKVQAKGRLTMAK